MSIQAIPTMWGGIQFRSRLEARWAAFFTKLDWDWSYEPIDLNNYIPDFIIHLDKDVLIEVKPFTRFDQPVVAEARQKVAQSGWGGTFGIVGSRFTGFWLGPDLVMDGLCVSCFEWNDRGKWRRRGPRKWRLAPSWDRGRCLSCGKRDFFAEGTEGEPCIGREQDDDGSLTLHDRVRFWHEAGNEVQWRGRQ